MTLEAWCRMSGEIKIRTQSNNYDHKESLDLVNTCVHERNVQIEVHGRCCCSPTEKKNHLCANSVLKSTLIVHNATRKVLKFCHVTTITAMCLQRNLLCVSGGVPATEPLRRGLNELSDVCQHVLNTFEVSLHVSFKSLSLNQHLTL